MDKQELIQLDTKALALRATNRYKLRLNERISPSIEFPSYAHEFSFENGMMLIHVNEDGVWVPDYDWNNQLGNRINISCKREKRLLLPSCQYPKLH